MAAAEIILADVRLPDGEIGDLRIAGGRIAEIGDGLVPLTGDAARVEAAGALVLPGLVDGHMHLDKTSTGTPWMPHQAGPDRMSRIETERTLRSSLPPVAERAANLVRLCIAHGTTAIRSHADVGPDIGISHVEALLEVRQRFAECVDIQIVAFPQYGVLRAPGTADLLAAALDAGADLLGGIDPIGIDGDLNGQLEILFSLADKKNVGVDIHLHDTGANGLSEIDAVTGRARSLGMQGRVTVSHGFCLGAAPEPVVAGLADAMATAGVSLVTHGGGASPLPPVKLLRARGVVVFAGNDDVRDPWSPYGEGDMLERAMLIAWRSGFRTDADLQVALDCASGAGKQALGMPASAIAVGDPADLFTVPAETPADAVARHPKRRLVLKQGRVVARDGVYAL